MDGEKKLKVSFRVREFDMERDLAAVEELERRCQVGLCGDDTTPDDDDDDDSGDDYNSGGGKLRKTTKRKKKKKGMSLSVEQVGDPLARVRHAPEHVMLVSGGGLTNQSTRSKLPYYISNKHITNNDNKQKKKRRVCLFGTPIRSLW